jgi:hypothetical protein
VENPVGVKMVQRTPNAVRTEELTSVRCAQQPGLLGHAEGRSEWAGGMCRLIAIKSVTDHAPAHEGSGKFGHANGFFGTAIPICRDHDPEPNPLRGGGAGTGVQHHLDNLFVRPKPPSQEAGPNRDLHPDGTIGCCVLNYLSNEPGKVVGAANDQSCCADGVPEGRETSRGRDDWNGEPRLVG